MERGGEWVIWLALLVGSLILEALSMQLFSVWFALGALASLATWALGGAIWLQILMFFVVSGIALLATRPLARKLQGASKPLNADRFIGKTAEVLEEIDNTKGTGTVRSDGKIWSARTEDSLVIPAGVEVLVLRIEGVKLVVMETPLEPENNK